MEQQMDLSALDGRQIDPETFRRVWARVMPEQENSPLVLSPPAPNERRSARPEREGAERKGTGEDPRPGELPAPEEREEERLERLMELLQEGAEGAGALSRRMGSRGRGMAEVTEDHRRALRRLAAAYFLATGRRRRPGGGRAVRSGDLGMGLREQYLWERRWEAACRKAAEETGDPALGELCRELAQDASLHQRTIRATLERM